MKGIYSLLLLSVCTLALVSCMEDTEQTYRNNTLKNISVSAEDFEYDGDSRTMFEITENGAEFSWSENDTIGIFPSTGAQAYFPMISGAGTKIANFTGGGWALKESSRYAAYYPFYGDFYLNQQQIPINYSGQLQIGDASTEHLGKYDLMAAAGMTPEKGNVNFAFKHLGVLVQLKLKLSKAASLRFIVLSTENESFPLEGTINLMNENIKIFPTVKSRTITLGLQNVITKSDGQTITAYMMLPPVDLAGQVVTVTAIDEESNSQAATFIGKNFESGKAYAFGELVTSPVETPVYYSIVENENASENEWNAAMFTSNGYYSMMKTDTLNNTSVFINEVGNKEDSPLVLGKLNEDGLIKELYFDKVNCHFFNHRDGIVDIFIQKDGKMEVINDFVFTNSEIVFSRGVYQEDIWEITKFITSILSSIESVVGKQLVEKVLGGLGVGAAFVNFTPEINLVVDAAFDVISGVGVAGAIGIGTASVVGAPIVVPLIAGIATAAGLNWLSLKKYQEAKENEGKKLLYEYYANSCEVQTLDAISVSQSEYNVGIAIKNANTIPSHYRNKTYYGIVLGKKYDKNPVYNDEHKLVLFKNNPSDGEEYVTISDLEIGCTYYYVAFLITAGESDRFAMSSTGEVIMSGNKNDTFIYYGEPIKYFRTDEGKINSVEQKIKPCYHDGVIDFTYDVTATHVSMESSYNDPTRTWGIVLYKNGKVDRYLNVGNEIDNPNITHIEVDAYGLATKASVKIPISIKQSELSLDYDVFTTTSLDKYSVGIYTRAGYSGGAYAGENIKYGERRIPLDLVYDEKPSLTFKYITLLEEEEMDLFNPENNNIHSCPKCPPLEFGDGSTIQGSFLGALYKFKSSIAYEVTGCLWIKNKERVMPDLFWTRSFDYSESTRLSDGILVDNYFVYYCTVDYKHTDLENKIDSKVYYKLNLKNGETIRSANFFDCTASGEYSSTHGIYDFY